MFRFGSVLSVSYFVYFVHTVQQTSSSPRDMFMHVADRANAIKIASWSMAVIMLMIFTARQTTKAVLFRRVALDDILILLAFVSS